MRKRQKVQSSFNFSPLSDVPLDTYVGKIQVEHIQETFPLIYAIIASPTSTSTQVEL